MDKILHFGVSLIISAILSYAFPSPDVAISFTLGLGLGKKYGDMNALGNHWDNYDLMADLAGITVGTYLGSNTRINDNLVLNVENGC